MRLALISSLMIPLTLGCGGDAEKGASSPPPTIDVGADADADADSDGVVAEDDCDDNDPASTTVANDADCDGVLTEDDCDDLDTTLNSRTDDGDCDGVVSPDDCDDSDDRLGDKADDADCDGITSDLDCNDYDAYQPANDADCDGYWTSYDCDDENPAINASAEDATVDGTDQNCDGYDGTLCLDDFTLEDLPADCNNIAGDLTIESTSHTTVSLDHLEVIEGFLLIERNNSLTEISMSGLKRAGRIWVSDNYNVESIAFDELYQVDEGLTIDGSYALTSLSLDALRKVEGSGLGIHETQLASITIESVSSCRKQQK